MNEFLTEIPAVFDDDWIAECEASISSAGDQPPDIRTPLGREFGAPAFLDEETLDRMKRHLAENSYDLNSRFAVLRFLWCNQNAHLEYGPDYEHADLAGAGERFYEFLLDVNIDAISTSEHARWELIQAPGTATEHLSRLCSRFNHLDGGDAEDLNLLEGRVRWWLGRGYPLVRDVIDPDPRFVSAMCFDPPEPDTKPENRLLVIDAEAAIRKVRCQDKLNGHWGILAWCAAATGEPGRAAEIYEKHWPEIVAPLFANTHLDSNVSMPETVQLKLADLWQRADRPEKVKALLQSIVATDPKMQGVNRRLAEIYNREGDFRCAYNFLRAEADADPAFGEDPVVSVALKAGIAWEDLERYRENEVRNFESRAVNSIRLSAIRSSLELCWPAFLRMSEEVKADWALGVFWTCEGLDWPDARSQARYAVRDCGRALETHLKQRVFEPFRTAATPRDKEQCSADPALGKFLLGNGQITLGQMICAILKCRNSAGLSSLSQFLRGHSSQPNRLASNEWKDLSLDRNNATHESRTPMTIEGARTYLERCREFLSILEDPPPAKVPPATGNRPIPGRPPARP